MEGQPFTIPVVSASDGTYKLGGDSGWQKSTSDFTVSLTGTIDTDPAIDYGLTVTDTGTPSSFSFTFSDPIAFPAGPSVVFSSISGGLGDVGGDGAFITPTGTKVQESSVGSPLTNMGVDVGNSLVIPATGSGRRPKPTAHSTPARSPAPPVHGARSKPPPLSASLAAATSSLPSAMLKSSCPSRRRSVFSQSPRFQCSRAASCAK